MNVVEDNFAVVEFNKSHANKKFVEVVRYEWLTDECTEVFCPKDKHWKTELKCFGMPKSDWKKYACRVLKSNINNLKAAHMECQLRLAYTSDSCDSSSVDIESSEKQKISNSTQNNYSNLFDQCKETDKTIDMLQDIITQGQTKNQYSPVSSTSCTEEFIIRNINLLQSEVDKEYSLPNAATDITGTKSQTLTQNLEVLTISDLHNLPNSGYSSNLIEGIQKTLHSLQEDVMKISIQNEAIMKMIAEINKKKPILSTLKIISDINSEKDLNDFEEKLKDAEYRKNMAFEYTQYAWKGDAKKEVNGFVKSIILKLFQKEFLHKIRWDRVSKKSDKVTSSEKFDDIIFLKKYTYILHLMTEVCNNNKKEGGIYYNKDNIASAAQDFFKRFVYKKNDTS